MKRRRFRMRRFPAVMLLLTVLLLMGCIFVMLLRNRVNRMTVVPELVLRGDAGLSDENSDTKDEIEPVTEFTDENAPWRKAYAEILRGSDAALFSFCYVDDDDIPELVLHMSQEFTHDNGGITVYTYYNSTAVHLGDKLCCDGYSNFLYVPRGGYVIAGFFSQNYGAYQIFELAEGKMQSLHTFDEDTNGEPICHVDDTEFPQWRYRMIFSQYAKGYLNDYGDYENTGENISRTLGV